jgi:hypothetical protein
MVLPSFWTWRTFWHSLQMCREHLPQANRPVRVTDALESSAKSCGADAAHNNPAARRIMICFIILVLVLLVDLNRVNKCFLTTLIKLTQFFRIFDKNNASDIPPIQRSLERDLATGARIIAKIYDRMNRIYRMESFKEALGGRLRYLR